ncbi:DUF927 domain-containing protein [Lentilactobacillus senioris]|uniref:DUF927 domain-containing protein n=1 Tax=Lentilactobacillus senioris TaxID=931534 RepID=UPI00227EA318|nr:DUF927 domain-containing protein [Lentilactobacillus senioris]MCY9806092.1 DUF927 domain-containing protein [Lentilactobacillus senioris]
MEELANTKKVIGGEFLSEDGKRIYYFVPKTNEWVFLCNYVAVIKRLKGLDMRESLVLEYYEKSLDTKLQLSIDSLNYQNIDSLVDVGITFSTNNRKKILDYLVQQKAMVPITWVVTGVGFQQLGNELTFVTDVAKTQNGNEIGINNFNAYRLKPQGSLSNWISMIQDQVLGHTALEMAVVLGMSATVLPIIKKRYTDIATLLVHFVGQSTSGKSTAQVLAVSVAGPPSANGGLMKTWATTVNAAMISLDGNNGIPVAFDELSMQSKSDLTEFVYQLTDGNEKARANRDATLKETKHWSTTIISSGELPLSDKIANNDGLRIRLLELNNVQFTDNAEQAEIIKKTASNNFGWQAATFANKLMNFGEEQILAIYEQEKIKVTERLPKNRYQERLAGRLAVITTTSELANQLLHFDFDTSKILELIVEHSTDSWQKDVGEESYADFIQYLIAKQALFPIATASFVNKEIMGQIDLIQDDYIQVDIFKIKFTKILNDIGYQDTSTIIKLWKESGYLIGKEDDRQTNRKAINGVRETVYSVRLDRKYLGSFYTLRTHYDENNTENGESKFSSSHVVTKNDNPFARTDNGKNELDLQMDKL